MRVSALGSATAAALLSALALSALGEASDPPASGPNVVVIMTDDMRLDELQYMPQTLHLLADQGVMFRQMLSPYPLCCPARAELLSGQYSHNNGVEGNALPRGGYYKLDSTNTLPVWLHDGGYETAFMGKYLNQYGEHDLYEVPPGWDFWMGSVTGIYNYNHVTTNLDGKLVSYPRIYQTSLFDSRSTDLIDSYASGDRPFFLWASYIAPHSQCAPQTARRGSLATCWGPAEAAYGDEGTFADLAIHDTPAVNEADMSDKGAFMRKRNLIAPERLATLHQDRILRIESLQSVDRAVAHLVEELKATGQYDNTYVIFTSDNGMQLGEHRWRQKVLGYEETVRVPLIISGPGLPHGVVKDQAVTLIDLAATIADVTGTTPQRLLDGESLLPLAAGKVPDGRDRVVLLEAGPRNNRSPGWLYRGVRTDQYTLLVWRNGDRELYDRRRDPLQIESVAGQPEYAAVERDLMNRLDRLETCQGSECLDWYTAPIS